MTLKEKKRNKRQMFWLSLEKNKKASKMMMVMMMEELMRLPHDSQYCSKIYWKGMKMKLEMLSLSSIMTKTFSCVEEKRIELKKKDDFQRQHLHPNELVERLKMTSWNPFPSRSLSLIGNDLLKQKQMTMMSMRGQVVFDTELEASSSFCQYSMFS